MDSEAASRGTTVYLVDKRIDMLPALLGTNLCSLRPFVERLAFSTIWVSAVLVAICCPLLTAIAGNDSRWRDRQRALYKIGHRFEGCVHLRGSTDQEG